MPNPGPGGSGDLTSPSDITLDIDEGPLKGPQVKVPRKTPEEIQEDVRSWLAVSLVIIFGGEVLFAAAFMLCSPIAKIDDLRSILTVVISPTVALVGSATGFYFGSHGKK